MNPLTELKKKVESRIELQDLLIKDYTEQKMATNLISEERELCVKIEKSEAKKSALVGVLQDISFINKQKV